MPALSQARLADQQESVALAKAFHDIVPAGTSEAIVFSAAISFVCACAEVSPRREVIAQLMRAAADELLKGSTGFTRPPTTH